MSDDDLERRLRYALRAVDRAAGEPRVPDRMPSRSAAIASRRPLPYRALVAAAVAAVLALGATALVARRDDDPAISVGGPDDVYEALGLFVVDAGSVLLCPDEIDFARAAECSGVAVPVAGVDPEDVPDDRSYLAFVGRLYTDRLVVDEYEVVPTPRRRVPERRVPGGPCAAQRAVRGSPSASELARATDAVRASDGFAGAWIERPGRDGNPEIVTDTSAALDDVTLVVATTRDADGAADVAAARWQGPVCVVPAPFTLGHLEEIQRAADANECDTTVRDCVVSTALDEPGNRVVVRTLVESSVLETIFSDEIEVGAVEIVELLRPVG